MLPPSMFETEAVVSVMVLSPRIILIVFYIWLCRSPRLLRCRFESAYSCVLSTMALISYVDRASSSSSSNMIVVRLLAATLASSTNMLIAALTLTLEAAVCTAVLDDEEVAYFTCLDLPLPCFLFLFGIFVYFIFKEILPP